MPPRPEPVRAASLRPLPRAADPRADHQACQRALRHGSRTFMAASLLLPRAVRGPACALYAFCRLADDAIDGAHAEPDAVQRLHERLDRVYRGLPLDHPADRALTPVVQAFAIPQALPAALLDGFAWDAQGRRYDTLEQLHDYAARVAGSVGAMMALLMGARSPAAVARACDLGVAMQLSNIARDVGEDARMGRLYLPRQWLQEAGLVAEDWLAAPRYSPALGQVVQRLLGAADQLYARADAGIGSLRAGCRPGIRAARRLYADIGHEVARRGLDSVTQRAVVPSRRKAGLLLHALLWPGRPAPHLADAEALPATRFLVDAVLHTPAPAARAGRRSLQQQALWVIDLFERLEQRDRAQFSA